MEEHPRRKVPYLVVDTSAFIKCAPLQELGENIITVPEVVNEIKNKRQLRRLIVLPYDLQVKDAFPENIKFGEGILSTSVTKLHETPLSHPAKKLSICLIFTVNEFSKQTGDFSSLSATDTSVIALTYQLEKKLNGVSHLNSAPTHKPSIEGFNTVPEELTNIVGFHLPEKVSLCSRTNSFCTIHGVNKGSDDDSDDDSDDFDDAREVLEPDDLDLEGKSISDDKTLVENLKNLKFDDEYINAEENENVDDENNDDGDWITPSNLNLVKNKMANDLVDDLKGVTVACLTTDYAMQNVLKQIGLHVISLDGKLIKQLRTFILRCYGCFKTTSIMTKVFCPNCGNKTLKKVVVSLDTNGVQHIHINFRKPLTARGKRYSLPRPKGGKHSNNPILCEDQPMPQQKTSRLSKTKNNPLNEDYIAGYSPFVMRDVTSKSAMLGIKPHIQMKHRMRKNPNEGRKFKK